MTSIKWPGATTGPLSGLTGTLRTEGRSEGVSSSARVTEHYQQASAGARSRRLGGSLAGLLDTALRRLDEAASSFAWPTAGFPFASQSRLAVRPPARAEDISASLPEAGGYLQEDKFLSRGFAASAPTSLEAGAYAMTLGLGADAQRLTVNVESGWTNAQVLEAVASAVNGSSLQVDAQVRSQTGSNILGPGVIPTGSFLALSVNRSRADQTPSLTDVSGHLAASLGLSGTAMPLGPAEAGTRQLTGLSVARPTLFRSSGLDPEAPTTLAPGTYTVAYAIGPDSGSVLSGDLAITISAGDTWGEVLSNMASVFGSASAAMTAQLVPARRVWDSATDERHAVVAATGLEVRLRDPKPGWRLSLSGGDLGGGSGNILSALGLDHTAQPGSDGRMVVDGRDRVRTPGTFSADQGRVVLEQSGTFGAMLPVSVLEPLDRLSQGLSDVVTAYNGLRDVLTKNSDLLRSGLAQDWRKPVEDRAGDLGGLGLAESGRDKLLWLQTGGFVQALVDNPERVRRVLLGEGSGQEGFLPALAGKAQDMLAAGAESLLLPESAFPARDPFLRAPSTRTELEIEKAGQLLDLLDSAESPASGPLPWEKGPGLLRRKG
ncbi:MAG: hypothetical protein KKA55_13955 [Proteobacteria bacterium]|nr:hypothetical protein [Pseudomonadota bacterium]MBU1596625.1 hypothetical protein [Pseudomonadota bacterium]